MQEDNSGNEKKQCEEQRRQMADALALAEKLRVETESLKSDNSSLTRQLDSQRMEIQQIQLMLEQAQRDIRMQYLAAVKAFSILIELRSPQLAAHGRHVAELARLIAKEMHATDAALQDIYVAALLHDIGKLGLNDNTLFKPVVELKGEPRVALMKHPMKAESVFHGLAEMAHVAQIIRHHHERYDGQGFPDGLAAEKIPLGARILAVAEDYDELQLGWLATKEFDEHEAQAFLMGASGKRYDPKVIAVLPAATMPMSPAEHAVTWNSGITVSVVLCAGSGGASPRRRAAMQASPCIPAASTRSAMPTAGGRWRWRPFSRASRAIDPAPRRGSRWMQLP